MKVVLIIYGLIYVFIETIKYVITEYAMEIKAIVVAIIVACILIDFPSWIEERFEKPKD